MKNSSDELWHSYATIRYRHPELWRLQSLAVAAWVCTILNVVFSTLELHGQAALGGLFLEAICFVLLSRACHIIEWIYLGPPWWWRTTSNSAVQLWIVRRIERQFPELENCISTAVSMRPDPITGVLGSRQIPLFQKASEHANRTDWCKCVLDRRFQLATLAEMTGYLAWLGTFILWIWMASEAIV